MKEELLSAPFIDIPEDEFIDNLVKTVEDIFKKYIYFDINTICKESIFYSDKDNHLNFYIKKYEILHLPFILSININLND